MSDKKISSLTPATTPLSGAELIPIVQGGTTVSVSVSNLTAGRAVSSSSQSSDLFQTSGGSVGSIANGATFDVLLPSAGQYFFVANQDGQSNGAFNVLAFVNAGSSSIVVTQLYGFGINVSTPSGLNVRVTNSAGGAIDMHYSFIRIG